MSCGKRALVKKWDKHKELRVIKPSRYEQNEASVKVHWKNVIRDLELSYKDEKVRITYILLSLISKTIQRNVVTRKDWA